MLRTNGTDENDRLPRVGTAVSLDVVYPKMNGCERSKFDHRRVQ